MKFASKMQFCRFFIYFCCVHTAVKSITWRDVGDFFTKTVSPYLAVERTIDDDFKFDFKTAGEIGKGIAEGTPVVGHVIAAAHLLHGNTVDAKRVLMSANSGTGAVAGCAFGAMCGPFAVLCVPALAAAGQTFVDAVQSVAVNESTGNIDCFVNFEGKSGVEHDAPIVGGSMLLDAVSGGFAGRAAKKVPKTTLINDKVATDSVKRIPLVESVKYVEDVHRTPERTRTEMGADRAHVPEAMEIDERSSDLVPNQHPDGDHVPMEVDETLSDLVPNQRPEIDDIKNSVLIPHDIQQKYYNELRVFTNEELAPIRNVRDFDDLDLFSQMETYTGPLKRFQSDGLKGIEDKCSRYLNGDVSRPVSTSEYTEALKLIAASIKTDPRSLLFPELFDYSDKLLFNVKFSDLVEINAGGTIDEASTNCARLSVHKVFGLDYEKITISPRTMGCERGYHINYAFDVGEIKNLLRSAGKEVNFRSYPFGIGDFNSPALARNDIKKTMIENNLKELYGVCTISKKCGGHAMTIRATLDPKKELSYMITDFQIQASNKIPHLKPSGAMDVIVVGKRFKQIEDLFEPNDPYQFFSYFF